MRESAERLQKQQELWDKALMAAISDKAAGRAAENREQTKESADTTDGVKNSVKDSDGRELSEQQIEYFKDSKVRDADGNLLVVYHGSPSKFTVFSANFINAHGNAHGRGFYFTENRAYAEGYEKEGGQLLSGYLNITKPMSESSVTMTRANVMALLKAVDPTGDDIAINYDRSGGKGYPSDVWRSRAYNDAVNALMTNENDVDIIAELTNAGGDAETVLSAARSILGYDGVIYTNESGGHEFVAFESNQFKNADNPNPTENQDIRYSQKLSTEGFDEMLSSKRGIRWANGNTIKVPAKEYAAIVSEISTHYYNQSTYHDGLWYTDYSVKNGGDGLRDKQALAL